MYKKVKIRHSQGVVDMSVRSGERDDKVGYEEPLLDLRELDRQVEEEEKSKKKRTPGGEMERIEFIFVRLSGKELKFSVPIEIILIPVRSVTKPGNLGIDIEYIVKNDDLGIKVKASNEMRGVRYFQEEFRKLCYWCMLDEEKNLPIHKIIQKRQLESFIDKEIEGEKIRRKYPLAPERRGIIELKECPEDLDSVQISQEVVGAEKKEKQESQEERIRRMREELKGKLEGTIYNDIQNVNLTNIPTEESMFEDLSPDRVIKEANELRKSYSPKLRYK
jgi:hypothetical protein